MSGEKTDAIRVNNPNVPVADDGTPTDIGWGLVRVMPDRSVQRICKGCAASAVSPFNAVTGVVEERAIAHRPTCQMFERFLQP